MHYPPPSLLSIIDLFLSISLSLSLFFFTPHLLHSVAGVQLGWEWDHLTINSTAFQQAVSDYSAALKAHDSIGATWKMATCGWVLGPLPSVLLERREGGSCGLR